MQTWSLVLRLLACDLEVASTRERSIQPLNQHQKLHSVSCYTFISLNLSGQIFCCLQPHIYLTDTGQRMSHFTFLPHWVFIIDVWGPFYNFCLQTGQLRAWVISLLSLHLSTHARLRESFPLLQEHEVVCRKQGGLRGGVSEPKAGQRHWV